MLYDALWLFFGYSFLGWLLESLLAAYRNRRFVNRGVLTGPLCCVYGLAALAITLMLDELRAYPVFLFIGSALLAGFVEWLSGRLLEKLYHRKWWDYTGNIGSIDGYVCLASSAAWGLLGLLSSLFLNPLLLRLAALVPLPLRKIVLWVLVGVAIVDALGSYIAILNGPGRMPRAENFHNRLLALSVRLNNAIAGHVQHRMEGAYPTLRKKLAETEEAKTGVFAAGRCFHKIFWLFFIGAFLGDITETLFCRATAGVWMSRSSVVWGPFSIVWGLAIALSTQMLYNYRNRSDGFLFGLGTVLGGGYEYICSVFTELLFGKVFWDYSKLPFNLGGRINLLYCFFWGIAAVVWLKLLYPVFSGLIEKIPMRTGRILTALLAVFMACNMLVSSAAMLRSAQRAQNLPAANAAETWLDANYSDETLAKIYPNAIVVDS